MGGQKKNFISDIVFFQHQDGMRKKVRRHFLQCVDQICEQSFYSLWKEFRSLAWNNIQQPVSLAVLFSAILITIFSVLPNLPALL
jgi:hypothetical protein